MFSKFRNIVLTAITLSSLLFSSQNISAMEINHNIGAGVGVPFGIIGVNYGLEMNIADSFTIIPTVAFGTSGLAGATDGVGLQVLFGKKSSRVRFGASYWSGANTIVTTSTYNLMKGNTAGINLRIKLSSSGKHFLDIAMLRRITPTKSEVEKIYGPVTNANRTGILPAVGYIYSF